MENRVSSHAVQRLSLSRGISWLLLLIFIFISVFPIYFVFKTALTDHKVLGQTAANFFPSETTFFNFARVLGLISAESAQAAGVSPETINFVGALQVTVLYVLVTVVAQVVFSASAAYAFARLRFPGRDFLFFLVLSAMMIPSIVLFIPNFILIKNLGWLSTFQGLVAPSLLISPFGVFFLRQFFLSVPLELEEAAKLDGATPAFIFWRIVLPLAQGPLATLGILTTIAMWNDFFWPFIVNSGSNENLRVLTVALQQFKANQPSGPPDWTGLMAGTFLSIVPVFVLLVLLGRRVVESLQFSGSK